MATQPAPAYAARLDVDYPEEPLDRLSTAFRILWIIPIAVVLALMSGGGGSVSYFADNDDPIRTATIGLAGSLTLATTLMILFRQKYPRWWFDFRLELVRFTSRVYAYLGLLTDTYPSTTDEQSVHLEIDYPDVKQDLNRWLPIVKWLLAIPHYIVLIVLWILATLAVIVAWFAILFTGEYPKGLFNFVVGVGRWSLRVWAYAGLLVTDKYPPFSMD